MADPDTQLRAFQQALSPEQLEGFAQDGFARLLKKDPTIIGKLLTGEQLVTAIAALTVDESDRKQLIDKLLPPPTADTAADLKKTN